ncbi:hypothetical protein, partial [Salmonella enterica]|uniref:hypothetical protein n=1 Tax=Salmonella enterica TaxID=28901 RepID=UPI00398C35EF
VESAIRCIKRAEKVVFMVWTTTSVMKLKKEPYYSKSITGRHLNFRVTLLMSFTEIDSTDTCDRLLRDGDKGL